MNPAPPVTRIFMTLERDNTFRPPRLLAVRIVLGPALRASSLPATASSVAGRVRDLWSGAAGRDSARAADRGDARPDDRRPDPPGAGRAGDAPRSGRRAGRAPPGDRRPGGRAAAGAERGRPHRRG